MIGSQPFHGAIGTPGSSGWLIREPESPYTPAPKPRLLDRVRDAIRTRRMSPRTEEAYVHWIRRFIPFHGKRHPSELGPPEITAFLTALAVQRRVSASTQNQALAALLFLYREVLGCDPGWLEGIVRAKRPQRLPVVLTRAEVSALLAPPTPCATASPPTCSPPGTTFAPSRNSSDTRTK